MANLALVTGASSGIGLEIARHCAEQKIDLVICADGPEIHEAGRELTAAGVLVQVVQADLATTAGVDQLYATAQSFGRPIDYLFLNAGRGLGDVFLDQDFDEVTHVINTNVTGTLYLAHKVIRDMRSRGDGKVLFTGSIAGYVPGSYHAIYNATKAFIDNFAYALRDELSDSGVTVTTLMPGPTDTDFFEDAGLLDTPIGKAKKDDPAKVAEAGFDAMMAGKGEIIPGLANKLQAAMGKMNPEMGARMHRKQAAPEGAKH